MMSMLFKRQMGYCHVFGKTAFFFGGFLQQQPHVQVLRHARQAQSHTYRITPALFDLKTGEPLNDDK